MNAITLGTGSPPNTNHRITDRSYEFVWELPQVTDGFTPIVVLSVTHSKYSKAYEAVIHTAVKDGVFTSTRYNIGMKSDAWDCRRVRFATRPVARYSAIGLKEFAYAMLVQVQMDPDDFRAFFITDESAGRS